MKRRGNLTKNRKTVQYMNTFGETNPKPGLLRERTRIRIWEKLNGRRVRKYKKTTLIAVLKGLGTNKNKLK
jgi:hypothetical protein